MNNNHNISFGKIIENIQENNIDLDTHNNNNNNTLNYL